MVDTKKLISSVLTSKAYIEYEKYHQNNIFSITKVSRWELVHSNFIAWILDPSGSHGLNYFPTRQLLRLLIKMDENFIPEEHHYDVFNHNRDILAVTVDREYKVPITGKGASKKIDLLIKVQYKDGILPIIIENKVGSPENGENGDQTVTYHDWAIKEFSGSGFFPPVFIYLVPLFYTKSPKCTDFRTIQYQELVNDVLEPCLWKTNNNWTYGVIDEYLKSLSYQTDNEKGHNTMAIPSAERKILDDFLDNNKNFINSLLEIWKEDATEEQIEIINKAQKIAKDFSRYEFKGSVYNKRQLVLAVINDYVDKNSDVTFDELNKTFPDSLQGTNGVVRLSKNVTDAQKGIGVNSKGKPNIERYFVNDEIELPKTHEKFMVCNQWGDNIKGFIEHVESLGYVITIKV